jgi:chorismate mutase
MLEKFRNEIDKIDEQLISLLKQRIKVVKKVGALKKKNGEKFFIRSAREADMIKALIKKSGKDLTKNLIIDIWRKLITAANQLEQPIQLFSAHQEEHLIRQYYDHSVPLKFLKDSKSVISSLKKNQAGIAIFALPPHNKDKWWELLPEGFFVFAQIPFDQKSKIKLVAVAAKNPEKSESDITLVQTKSGLKKIDGFHLSHKSGRVIGHFAK